MKLIHTERMSPVFEKWRLKIGKFERIDLHHFTGPDVGDPA